MRHLLENCLLLLFLFITSATDAERKFQIICADKSSHCKRRSHLCQSNAFRSVMQSLCKKTCNLCEDNRKEKIVEQDEHEKEIDREIVDIEEDDEDTDNGEYSELEITTDQMEEEEEVTKESLTTLSTIIPRFTTKGLKCTDSSIDCEGKRYLCSERTYANLMSRECPETCGLCQSGHQSSSDQTINGITKNGMNIWKCRDIAPDCNESLCNHRSYRELMKTICMKTCSLCHLKI